MLYEVILKFSSLKLIIKVSFFNHFPIFNLGLLKKLFFFFKNKEIIHLGNNNTYKKKTEIYVNKNMIIFF